MATDTPPRRVGRPRGPRPDPVERRNALLDAAERAIRANGADVSLAQIAAEAGISRPILYDAFGDRAGLAGALAERRGEELGQVMVLELQQAIPLHEVVGRIIESFVEVVDTEPDVFLFLVSNVPHDSASFEGLIAESLAAALHRAAEAAGRDPAPAPLWGQAIVGMALGAAEWWSATRTMSKDRFAAELTAMANAVLRDAGIADTPGPLL